MGKSTFGPYLLQSNQFQLGKKFVGTMAKKTQKLSPDTHGLLNHNFPSLFHHLVFI